MNQSSRHHRVDELLLDAKSMVGNSDSPHLDCQLILAFSLGQTREWVIANGDELICDDITNHFRENITRRGKGEPVAYILGHKDFWEERFVVTRNTLIPRPETELLVETALAHFDKTPRLVVDLGTGSGVIAISLAAERPDWQIVAVDTNPHALTVAKNNATKFGNLAWLQGCWGSALQAGSIDLLVCNPPYIAENDPCLERLAFEPQEALVSADNGLADLHAVIGEAQHLLKSGGHLLLEHGHVQQAQVCEKLRICEFSVTPLRDLQGHPRAVLAMKIAK